MCSASSYNLVVHYGVMNDRNFMVDLPGEHLCPLELRVEVSPQKSENGAFAAPWDFVGKLVRKFMGPWPLGPNG